MGSKRWMLASLFVAGAAAPCLADGSDVRVVIGFKGDADADLVARGGGNVLGTVSGARAVVANVPAARLSALRANASVAYVEEDGIAEAIDADANAKPPGTPGGGGSTEPAPQPAETTPWGVSKVLHGAQGSLTGAGIDVAVIDTGIDLDHPDLVGNVEGGVSYVARAADPNDDNGHGTHVAGTIGAIGNNGIGVVGVAPSVNLWAVKVLDKRGSGYWSDVAAGILWTKDHGIEVANMSLGGSNSSVVSDACTSATNGGVLLIAAAGNSGDGNLSTSEVSYPAGYASVVSVGATTSGDGLASFSNTNSDVEVSGPGSQVPSTYKDAGYKTLSGTSMACPHAVGIAALIWQSLGSTNAGAVRSTLQTKVVDLGATGRDNGFGFGRVDIAP